MGRVLAFDFGERRIGVAVAAEALGVATGLPTIVYSGRRDLYRRLARLIEEREPDLLLVGLPLNMDGSRGERANVSAAFAGRLEEWFGLPVQLHDERLTTMQAERIRKAAGIGGRKARRQGLTDRAAAVLLLQNWLDRNRSAGGDEEREIVSA